MPSCSIEPIPLQAFLDQFLPKNGSSRRRIRKDIFKNVQPGEYVNDHLSRSFVGIPRSLLLFRRHWTTRLGLNCEQETTLSGL